MRLRLPTHAPRLMALPPRPSAAAGTSTQVAELSSGLQRLDHLLLNVTHEQRYLYARTVRHLRTVQSTHSRALWYQLLIYFFIVLTSFAQVGVCAGRAPGLPRTLCPQSARAPAGGGSPACVCGCAYACVLHMR